MAQQFELKECIKGQVTFLYYKAGNLWYETENGLAFPVPLSDTGEATFSAKDKAMLFMRYIRKQLAHLEEARQANVQQAND